VRADVTALLDQPEPLPPPGRSLHGLGVIAAYTSTDGKPYVVLFNLSDPTWRKTLSLAELESGSRYIRLPRI
jgi:hypothetical protein